MIIVDRALEQREREGRPIRVGLVGAGFMGSGIVFQITAGSKGMRVVAISNRTPSKAEEAYRQAGVTTFRRVETLEELEATLKGAEFAVSNDPMLLCSSREIDVIIEATGEVEFGAQVAMSAIEHHKHLILMNAELDATLGPLLKVYGDRSKVVITNSDGDQPGVIMNLYRFVNGLGCRPLLAGNIKGLQDPYRTPETQRSYAARYHLKPTMATAFADGTKISMEMAVVANATGFKVGKRGMYGFRCGSVHEAVQLFPVQQLLDGGLVDYLIGAEPPAGVFVLGYNEHPMQRHYLNYYKMGEGPFYVFYTPYHLCHLEVPTTVGRAVLFQDAAVTPLGGPVCEVITLAKRELKAGEGLDGIGGFTCYGVLENADVSRKENLLPMGLSDGCRLTRDIPKDQSVTFDDVDLPEGRFCDRLWSEQQELFTKRK